jgi:hypothetical protein
LFIFWVVPDKRVEGGTPVLTILGDVAFLFSGRDYKMERKPRSRKNTGLFYFMLTRPVVIDRIFTSWFEKTNLKKGCPKPHFLNEIWGFYLTG